MLDVSKVVFDALNNGWVNPAQLLDCNVEAVESDTVDVKLLSTEMQNKGSYNFACRSAIMILVVVKHPTLYKQKCYDLVNYIMRKLLESPDLYSKLGLPQQFDINYQFDDKGDSNFAVGSIRFSVNYLDSVSSISSNPNISTLAGISGKIDVAVPNTVIDGYFNR